MLPHTPSRKRASRSISTDQPRSGGKRHQRNSPYVSQGNASCSICQDQAVQLVQLGACCHAVCRSCMTSHLLHAFKLGQLPLRCPLPHCRAKLGLQSAVQLMEQQVPGSKALAAKVLLAGADPLALLPDGRCFACPYADCQVPLELDAQLPDCPSDCPACSRPVCGTCRSKWHSGLRCVQYQALAGARFSNLQQQQPFISANSTSWQQTHHCAAPVGQQQQVMEFHLPHSINITDAAASILKGSSCIMHEPYCGSAAAQDNMAWSPSKQSSGGS